MFGSVRMCVQQECTHNTHVPTLTTYSVRTVRTPRVYAQAYTRAYACVRPRYFPIETITVLHCPAKKGFFFFVGS